MCFLFGPAVQAWASEIFWSAFFVGLRILDCRHPQLEVGEGFVVPARHIFLGGVPRSLTRTWKPCCAPPGAHTEQRGEGIFNRDDEIRRKKHPRRSDREKCYGGERKR